MAVSTKPKILYIITKANFGGAQKYVFDLASDSSINNEFEVVVAVGGSGELVDRLESVGVRVVVLENLKNTLSPFKTINIINEIRDLIKKEKPNIVHINSSMAGLSGTIACRLSDVPSVFTAHAWPFNENRPMYQKVILKILMTLVVILSTKTISVSKVTSLQLYLKLKNKFVIIYNGMKNLEFHDEGFAQDKFNLDSGKVNIVSIGELHTSKGHDLVLEGLTTMEANNYHYHIIGEGNFRGILENQIESSNLESRVTLHGYVADASKYLKIFDLFLLPSRTEALPYVLAEAYAAGLPVITTDVGGTREIVEYANYGVIVPSSVEGIRTALENSIVDIESAEFENAKLGKILWTHDSMVENTKKVYKDILK